MFFSQYNRASTSTVAVSSSDTLTDMTSIGPEAGHITVTIQGQDPMYIHTADTLPPEEEQFISVSYNETATREKRVIAHAQVFHGEAFSFETNL